MKRGSAEAGLTEDGGGTPRAPLRAAVVGLGMMGRNHVRVYDEVLTDVELVAVADPDAAALRRATTGRAARGYADAAHMFAEESLDLVSIVAPTSLHRDVTLAALAAGANVLVEKPIASDRADAELMIAAAADAGRILTVGHIERFNPAVRELRRRLVAGELGRIFQVKATRLGPFPARIRDVGVVLDLAPHDLDVMRFLLDSDPVRIYAETEQRIHTDHEDLFNGIIKFANGVIGILDINWLTPNKRRTLTVTGERGMYVADYIKQDLIYYANPDAEQIWENRGADDTEPPVTSVTEGEMTRHYVRRREPLAVELAEFARAVRDGGPPPVDPRDAMVALLLAGMMVEAATRGEVISGVALAEALA
ncbi:MAG: Gfo/Idh/MocA family oxidoreductase [Chloroflexota bacterium]|nr:Gfo/Idh/MocA family oxidoreductase [Chloroflexota bacterium]